MSEDRSSITAIQVRHLAKHRYRVSVGRHSLIVDQPITAGGEDDGPTAVQLFAASVIACVAHYGCSYLTRHGLSTDGLVVDGDFAMAGDGPARVASLSVSITPPPNLPARRKVGLLAVASHCTLHHTLRHPPAIDIVLSEPSEAVNDAEPCPVLPQELVGAAAPSSPAQQTVAGQTTKERP